MSMRTKHKRHKHAKVGGGGSCRFPAAAVLSIAYQDNTSWLMNWIHFQLLVMVIVAAHIGRIQPIKFSTTCCVGATSMLDFLLSAFNFDS